jgi:DNA (cytosine-5)-methyltransferase 1
LIPTLPESKFADWQLARLPAEFGSLCWINGNTNTGGTGFRPLGMPATTVAVARNGDAVAFLVEGDAAGERPPFLIDGKPANFAGDLQITHGDNPVVTVTASQDKHPFRAWLEQGRVVSMTPRALARFQSFPDSYLLPENKTLAGKIIGNAVPPKLMQAILP